MIDIKLKRLVMRNFFSYGNNETVVNLDFTDPTLIIGRNFDQTIDGQMDSNGAGKTTILNAISVALYDKTISKLEKKNGFVNRLNGKDMYVSVDFIKDGNTYYRIERYRKNKAMGGDGVRVLRHTSFDFDMSPKSPHDVTPDSIGNANAFISKEIGIPFDVFSRIVIFSAAHEPFLSLPSSHASAPNQKDVIEELFGITELSEKAEILKGQRDLTKAAFEDIEKVNNILKRERQSHEALLASVSEEKSAWGVKWETTKNSLTQQIEELADVDFAAELEAHASLKALSAKKQQYSSDLTSSASALARLDRQLSQANAWGTDQKAKIARLLAKLESLPSIESVEAEQGLLSEIASLTESVSKKRQQATEAEVTKKSIEDKIAKLEDELSHLNDSNCPYCKQKFKDAATRIDEIEFNVVDLSASLKSVSATLKLAKTTLAELNNELATVKGKTTFGDLTSLNAKLREIDSAKRDYENARVETNPYDITEIEASIQEAKENIGILEKNLTIVDKKLTKASVGLRFPTEREAVEANGRLTSLRSRLQDHLEATNPHDKTFARLADTKFEALKDDELDKLAVELEHQNFLYKLLTKKDSFIRKILLQKNLPFLNERLRIYIGKLGLPHKVQFMEDLSVTITQFGTDFEYGGISAGQRARINIALAFAFRDVLQARHGKINFCILDEILDTGLSNVGVQMAADTIKRIAKDEKLTMFVISHRDEIASMFNSRMTVELRNGFSTIVDE